jgi:hypothetical protein
LYPGGITWADIEGDISIREVLSPVFDKPDGLPMALDMLRDSRSLLTSAFYLDKLSLPPVEMSGDMTAFEAGERVQEYIRNALPLFEPLEDDYNGGFCEGTFDLLMQNGAFGSLDDIPQSLRGAAVQFRFNSPLREAIERQKAQRFMEAGSLIERAVTIDQSVGAAFDANQAFRDAMIGAGMPQAWLRSEEDTQALIDEQKQQQAEAMALQAAQMGGGAMKDMAAADKDLGAAQPVAEAA